MAKRGVFGPKEMPLDAVRETKPKPAKRDKEVRIRKINGGFIVSCSPDSDEEYRDAEHAVKSLEAALEKAGEHLEGKKEDRE